MNIETGEIRQFENDDALTKAFEAMSPQEKENWVKINDPSKITKKQLERLIVSEYDHRSTLGISRDILRIQERVSLPERNKEAGK